jgi:hypothetical protein
MFSIHRLNAQCAAPLPAFDSCVKTILNRSIPEKPLKCKRTVAVDHRTKQLKGVLQIQWVLANTERSQLRQHWNRKGVEDQLKKTETKNQTKFCKLSSSPFTTRAVVIDENPALFNTLHAYWPVCLAETDSILSVLLRLVSSIRVS